MLDEEKLDESQNKVREENNTSDIRGAKWKYSSNLELIHQKFNDKENIKITHECKDDL